jgi:hypothetical protein
VEKCEISAGITLSSGDNIIKTFEIQPTIESTFTSSISVQNQDHKGNQAQVYRV